jgi:hypothetical protein
MFVNGMHPALMWCGTQPITVFHEASILAGFRNEMEAVRNQNYTVFSPLSRLMATIGS